MPARRAFATSQSHSTRMHMRCSWLNEWLLSADMASRWIGSGIGSSTGSSVTGGRVRCTCTLIAIHICEHVAIQIAIHMCCRYALVRLQFQAGNWHPSMQVVFPACRCSVTLTDCDGSCRVCVWGARGGGLCAVMVAANAGPARPLQLPPAPCRGPCLLGSAGPSITVLYRPVLQLNTPGA